MRRHAYLVLLPILSLRASADDLHDRLERAVNRLRSDDAAERDKGSAELEVLAKEAPELVQTLADDKDPEVKARVLEVLSRLPVAEAEALFKKVDDRYALAKTIQYKVEHVQCGADMKIEGSSIIATKLGNRVRIDHTGTTIRGNSFKHSLTCDGEKMRTTSDGLREKNPFLEVASVDRSVREWMIRVGVEIAVYCDYVGTNPLQAERYSVDNLKSAADEKLGDRMAKVLSFTLNVNGRDTNWQEKIWVDPETAVLLKREATCSDGVTVTRSRTTWGFRRILDRIFTNGGIAIECLLKRARLSHNFLIKFKNLGYPELFRAILHA